jgi:hypothetical protein
VVAGSSGGDLGEDLSEARLMLTDRTLAEYSREHLKYEIEMLFRTAHRLATTGAQMDDVTRNAFIESFTIHARALGAFLYDRRKWDDDVLSEQYVTNVGAWHKARRQKPRVLRRSGERVGKEIGHLTLRRYRGAAPQKQWDIFRLCGQLTRSLKQFAKHADPQRLHRDVRALIDSLQLEEQPQRARDTPG